jgi:hypothetical protein
MFEHNFILFQESLLEIEAAANVLVASNLGVLAEKLSAESLQEKHKVNLEDIEKLSGMLHRSHRLCLSISAV